MNILVLTKTFPLTADDWKGIFVKRQADAIASEHAVTVVRFSADYDKFSPFFSYSVKAEQQGKYLFYNIIVRRSFPVYNQFNFIVSVFLALKKIIKEKRPDIIHCHYSYPAGVIARMIRKKFGIPYVITEHTRMRLTFRSVFHRKLSLMALRESDRVIAVSGALKEELEEEGISNVEVIPNVIDADNFHISGKKSDPFTIGFLGSLANDNKGLDILIAACRELPFVFKLKAGGSGALLQHYKDFASEKIPRGSVTFPGEIRYADVNSFYEDISLFVLASRYETFSMVLLEAMACGIPVVATSCGGPSDIVNEKSGILVKSEDPDMMREAIIKIQKNYEDYHPEEIREYVISTFGAGAFMKHINTLYRSCLLK